MPFDPNQPFSVEDGGTAVADAPKGFDPSQPFTVEDAPLDPVKQGQQALASVSSGATPLPADAATLEKGSDAYYHTSALKRLGTGAVDAITGTPTGGQDQGAALNTVHNAKNAVGGLLSSIGTGLGNVYDENKKLVSDAYNNPTASNLAGLVYKPLLTLPTAGAVGAYNTGKPLLAGSLNYLKAVDTDAIRAAGGLGIPGASDLAANIESGADFNRLKYEKSVERPAIQAVNNLSGLPATSNALSNIVPLVTPLGAGIETAELASNLGNAVSRTVSGIADASPVLTGAATHAVSHAILPGGGGLLSRFVRPVVAGAFDKAGDLAGFATRNGINASVPILTGGVQGLLSADPGEEAEGARAGAAQGALAAPVSMYAGRLTNQTLERAALKKESGVRGMTEFGNNPAQDASDARGIATLPPEIQQAIFEQRGVMRETKNPEGNQIQIHVPDDYEAGATANNGGIVDDAANSRGYYLDGKGGVYINPSHADTLGALNEALGHEVGHSVYQDALPGVNQRAATRLTSAVADQALDSKLQPTPGFQAFIDRYATLANGTPTTVDWNSLPASGDNGLTRTKLINELGAETVRAATPDVGQQLYGRTLENRVSDFASDLATRLGLKDAPNAAAILKGNVTSPIGVSALQAARKGTYAIGAKARQGFDSPVRIAEPDAVKAASKSTTPPTGETPPQVPTPSTELVPSPQPDTSFRQTQAYQDALSAITAPRKNGGMGLKPVAAQLLLDQAARDPAVPNDPTAYFGYAQKQRAPIIPPKADAPTATNTPILAPAVETPELSPTSSLSPPPNPNIPTVSPTAKRIYLLPGGPGGAKRIEVPTATQPVLTLPTAEPVAQKVVLPKSEPVNRFAGMEEPPVTGPTDKQLSPDPLPDQTPPQTGATSPLAPEQSPRDAGHDGADATGSRALQNQDGAQLPANSAPDENTSQASSDATTQSPLSASDIARIESEAEKNFAYTGPKPTAKTLASNPNELADRTAAALAKAKQDAVAKAHADALPPEDDRVRATVDPDTGTVKLDGKRFVEGDAFHDQLLRNATDGEKANLSTVQDAIGQGKALNFDYDSALPLRGEDTNAQRQESQALSTATDREQGVGLAQEANHTFIPLSASPTASGHAQVFGYAPDKVLGNAETAIRLMRDSGLSDRLPYTGINDPSLTSDIRAYTENHANGYKGDGSAKLQPTEGVSVPQGDPNYQPQPLPPAKAHFINLIMGQDDTLSQKQAVKTGPNAGKPTNSATLRNFAAANDNVPSASGEVNPLRDELNRKGVLKVGNDKGSGEVLHSAFENIKPGLITRFHDQPSISEVPPLRASSFEGDRGSIAPGGKTPNRQASAAGFLPAREAGATPEQAADAAKQWQEKGTDSPYFKNWFGDSKVTDGQGNPLIVKHGTRSDFDSFDPSTFNKHYQSELGDGFYFTTVPKVAQSYASDGGKVIDSYLSLKNPFLAKSAAEAKSVPRDGQWDGIVYHGDLVDGKPYEYVAFKPEQVKSATSNNGRFNPKDPRISFLPAREAGAGTPEQVSKPNFFDLPPAERATEMQRLKSFPLRTKDAQATIRPETYDFSTPSGSSVVGRQQDVYVGSKVDPDAGELFSIDSKKPGEGLSLALDAIGFLKHAGKNKIVFNHIGTEQGRALVDGLSKIKAIGEPLGKFDSNSEVYSLD